MATQVSYWPTLFDEARRLDGNGKLAAVAEILNEQNDILDDIPFVEGNLPTGHKTTLRKSIPAPTWRLLNQGVTPVKSVTDQITETCGMMENYSEIDKALADLNGNTAEWRLSEDKAIIEGMNQSLAETLIYGDTSVSPEKFVGLAPRYYTLDTSENAAAANVINAAGTDAVNTSIWLVGWSTDTVHGIYPKGSKAGLSVEDLGEQTLYDVNGGRFQGYRTHYKWDVGLAVRDWRYVVRIANIDTDKLKTTDDASDKSANIVKYMSTALDSVPNLNNARFVFYANNLVRSMMRVKLLSRSNVWLTMEGITNGMGITRPTLAFMGYPVRRIDQILNTEAVIT